VVLVLPDSEFTPIGRSIGRTHKFLHAWGDRELAPIGGSVTEFVLLFHIESALDPGLSQTEVARFSDMGGPALVRHLDRLERDGLVQRTRDAADRRIMRVTLTDTGRARLADLKVVIERIDEQVRAVLSHQEAKVLQGALDKVFQLSFRQVFAPSASASPQSNVRSVR
jgi:MarR family transcriptional regulator for hemolysin